MNDVVLRDMCSIDDIWCAKNKARRTYLVVCTFIVVGRCFKQKFDDSSYKY